MFSGIESQRLESGASETDRVLMLAPFSHQQRGNAITVERLYRGLLGKGCRIEVESLEDETCWKRIKEALAQNYYRFVHGFNAYYMAEAFKRAPQLAGLPLVLTTTGTDLHYGLHGPNNRKLKNIMVKAAYTVVFNPQFKTLLDFIPDYEKRVLCIPQGVWLEADLPCQRSQLGLTDRDVVFILPSGLRPVKNLDWAVEGLALIKPQLPYLKLLIVGASIEKSYAQGFLSRVADLSWVVYLGEIPHNQITGFYLLGDVVINSSLAEGQPQAALEAMSLARPALLSAVPGNLGIMEHGCEGYYFGSPAQLAEYALELGSSPEKRLIMGERARDLTRRCFSLPAEVDAYKHLYDIMFRQYTGRL
ncbi:MAG: glycosyltransferase [Syntrophomonadaceae bacterium]